MIMYCDICGAKFEDDGNIEECPECLCPFANVDKNSSRKWFKSRVPYGNTIKEISNDESFMNAMVELYEKDPIEYQLKIQQFKSQIDQQENKQQTTNDNEIKCPTCDSTRIKKITLTSKAANTALFGLFGTKRHKTFHCNSCGYEW